MITKEQKIRLGVFLLIAGALLTAILAIFVVPQLKTKGEIYYIAFKDQSVNGVNLGASVKYQGVDIGKVILIDVNPNDLRSVHIHFRVKTGFPVKEDMRATLQYAGITGLRFVELSGGKNESKDLPPGGRILTKKGLGEKAEDIVLNVDSVVEALNDMLNLQNREKISLLLGNIEKGSAVVSNLLEKREKNLGNSLENIEKITHQLTDVVTELHTFTLYLKDVSEKVNPERLDQMAAHTDELIQTLKKRLSDAETGKLLKSMDTFIERATVSIRKLETQFGDLEGEMNLTLTSLRESLENISRFTRQLSEDPTVLIRSKAAKRRQK